METWNIITIATLLVISIVTIWFVIAMIKTVRKISIQQLEHSSKLLRDIDKLRQSMQDDVCAISKLGDAFKPSIALMRDLQKAVSNLGVSTNSALRCVENLKQITFDKNSAITKSVEDVKRVVNSIKK